MAPTLIGPHRPVTCSRCGHRWRIAAETVLRTDLADCEQCGAECHLGSIEPGQLVLARPIVAGDAIARLDCVVFRMDHSRPAPAIGEWTCKRVWGLPGESIRLANGDLQVDAQTFAKSLEQLRAIAIPVDNRHDGPEGTHWQIFSDDTAPPRDPATWPVAIQPGERLCWNPQPPITDDYECNLDTPRNLAEVDDLLFDLRLDCDDGADSQATYELEIYYRGNLYRTSLLAPTSGESARAARRLTIATCDGRVLLRGEEKPTTQVLTAEARCDSPRTLLTILCGTGVLRVLDIAVHRDLYLRTSERDPSVEPERPVLLQADEYFVIGDNLPISVDSRNQLGVLPASRIWGVVTADR